MRTTVSKNMQVAICIAARAEDDLIVGKAYQLVVDKSAAEVECLRVIDESGEDYLYPAKRFVLVELPRQQFTKLLKAVRKKSA